MFRLNNISLYQFKTYKQAAFTFTERIVSICGSNGVGKTNLLDAIYYLCFTKSYFTKSDQLNVHNGTNGFRLEGNFELNNEPQHVVCILRETGKKEFSVNEELYEKFSTHIGKFPCVIIAPDDVQIITGGSEERRRFTDTLLCQLDEQYLLNLISYNKILQQRNSFLKSLAENKKVNKNLLDVYDEQLIRHGNYVFEKRKTFLHDVLPLIKKLYNAIAGNEEMIDLVYDSHLLNSSFENLIRQSREKDILTQRTNSGIHRDDIDILINKQPFKNSASQGQRKSLLFAMKLAEFDMLKKEKGFPPILLLDDVFEKLDEQRMYNLLQWVCLQNDAQVFITDTHRERIVEHFGKMNLQYQSINL
ncbi:MAG: DNA replication and repair protein RecF [Bacteroidetes bacterium]|nr:DNA replication and repair protein RecF [Bacteroidota bacterium]